MLGSNHVGRLLHRRPGECRCLVRLAHARLGVHALDRDDSSQARVGGWLGQLRLARLRSRVVGNQVEVLARGGGDAERLLHQAVGLVPVSLRFAIVVVLVATTA